MGNDVSILETKKNNIQMIWDDDGWKNWRDLHDSAEMKKLLKEANDKLKQCCRDSVTFSIRISIFRW